MSSNELTFPTSSQSLWVGSLHPEAWWHQFPASSPGDFLDWFRRSQETPTGWHSEALHPELALQEDFRSRS